MPSDNEIFDNLQNGFQKQEWEFHVVSRGDSRTAHKVTITKYTNGRKPLYIMKINGLNQITTNDPTDLIEFLSGYSPEIAKFLAEPTN